MRLVTDPKLEFLARLPLFEGCNRDELAAIGAAADRITVPRHRPLALEGTSPTALYVIVSGIVQVRRGDRVLAYLQDGEVVGELGLLDRTPRTATVTTVVDTDLLVIDRRHLAPMLGATPRVAGRLERIARPRRAAA